MTELPEETLVALGTIAEKASGPVAKMLARGFWFAVVASSVATAAVVRFEYRFDQASTAFEAGLTEVRSDVREIKETIKPGKLIVAATELEQMREWMKRHERSHRESR